MMFTNKELFVLLELDLLNFEFYDGKLELMK
jgi:hypothetical protein